jgi:hypothetical protein
MKLRKIDSHNYCDDETGAHFRFPLLKDTDNLEQVEAMIQKDMECYAAQYPMEGYLRDGQRIVIPTAYIPPHLPPEP